MLKARTWRTALLPYKDQTHTLTHKKQDSETDTEELCQDSTSGGRKYYMDMLEAVRFVLF